MLVFLFYFACIIISIIIIIAIMTMLSTLELKIDNLNINSQNKEQNNKKIILSISLTLFNICWFKVKINKKKLASLYVKQKIQLDKKQITLKKVLKGLEKDVKNKMILKAIKSIKINLKKLKLDVRIATDDYILTSYIVAIISIIISNTLPHVVDTKKKSIKQIQKNYKYCITPIYNNKKIYNIKLDCIIATKIGHIIHIIYLIKRSSDKNERTSNRKSYEYSYE